MDETEYFFALAGLLVAFLIGALVGGIVTTSSSHYTITSGTVTSLQDISNNGNLNTVITVHHSDGTQVAAQCANLNGELPLVGANVTLLTNSWNYDCQVVNP